MIEWLKKNLTEHQKTSLRRILNNFIDYNSKIIEIEQIIPNLSYDSKSKKFFLSTEGLDWNDRAKIRRTLMGCLRQIPPRTTIRLDRIKTGYYDQCLERYIFERLNRNLSNKSTCWFAKAQNNKCIGWWNPDELYGEDEKNEFINNLISLGKNIDVRDMIPNLERDKNGFIFYRSNEIYEYDDKIMKLVENIRSRGFCHSLISQPPIIFGYSKKLKNFNVISGRHRIAALKYLVSQGEVNGLKKIPCHIVEYNCSSLVVTRPYDEKCKTCEWSGVFDPGQGSHQDFFVRDGIAIMRGEKNKKGGRQKWEIISPLFREMVFEKKVLDVGAYKGLYCIKALEYGAEKATALEISEDLSNIIIQIKDKYVFNNLDVVNGNFFDPNDFKKLKKEYYGTAFYFGIIHHLLRIGIQKEILFSFDELLEKISSLVTHGVIIEYAKPKENDLKSDSLLLHAKKFSEEAFVTAMNKNFAIVQNLGKCRYKSGNPYGRFMYIGLKKVANV